MKHILIVEDEKFLLNALEDNLKSEGYKVSAVADGKRALAHIQKNPPDLILLDLLMPKVDGFEVLKEVKQSPTLKQIPVFVLSNLGADEEIKRALQMGADDYFVKSQHPIEEVIEKVKGFLKGKERNSKLE